MDLSLKNYNALVCGSTQGIGWSIAKEIAGLGATCILMARNEDKLAARVSELPAEWGQKHEYRVADFSDISQVQSTVVSLVSRRRIHLLVNNTGGPKPGPVEEAQVEEFEAAFRSHLLVNHILTRAVVPGMKREGFGRILNIISTSVRIPITGLGVSNTIRGAVASWAKTMANELGPFNITVNNILPGYTSTSRLESLISNNAEKRNISTAQLEEEMKRAIPLRRFGKPEETAAVAAFLLSPAASYVSGVSIPVDGGSTGAL